MSATHLLCAARSQESGEVGLIRIAADAPGVQIRPLAGFAWNLAEVTLSGVKAEPPALLGGSFAAGWVALQQAIVQDHPGIERVPGGRLSGGI